MPQIGVSSSLVRERVREGRPIRYLVPGCGARADRGGGPVPRRPPGRRTRPTDTLGRTCTGAHSRERVRLTPQESLALVERIAQIADDKLARDIVILDMADVVGYTDYFLIATGNTGRQTSAIAQEIAFQLKEESRLMPLRGDGQALQRRLDPARLRRRRRAPVHPGGTRLLPSRAAVGPGAGAPVRVGLRNRRGRRGRTQGGVRGPRARRRRSGSGSASSSSVAGWPTPRRRRSSSRPRWHCPRPARTRCRRAASCCSGGSTSAASRSTRTT